MQKLFYLIDKMTQAMDSNIYSIESANLRLLVFRAKVILESNESPESIEQFNTLCTTIKSNGEWSPYDSW